MPKEYAEIEFIVKSRVTNRVFNTMLNYLEAHRPSLWGEEQPRNFLKRNLIMALYKDMENIGYQKLLKEVRFGTKLNHKSLEHNTEAIREVLAEWGKASVKLGSVNDWNTALRNVQLNKKLEGVNLWIDSTDFPMEKKKGRGPKDPYWSYKENTLGSRFMFILDGKGRIRKAWGGYSPKVYDSHFLEIQKDWIEENMSGAGFIADSHFKSASKLFKNIEIFTAYEEPSNGKRKQSGENIQKLTKEQQAWNKAIHSTRARVENPFGEIKTLFHACGNKWSDTKEQLDMLVWVAIGILNNKTY